MKPSLWIGEGMRWYLTRARHPFKNYIVGHYWSWFSRPRVWVRYDGDRAIGVCLEDYLQRRIFFEGYYERTLIDWLKTTLTPDDVFWDVGANIGAVSLVAAGLCRRVVAFEPDPRSLEALESNLRANRITNVEVVGAALGLQAGRALLHQSAAGNTGMTTLMPGRAGTVESTEVDVRRADDLVGQRPELAPTVMKIDVEGAEHLVLGGARALLRSGRVRAIVFEDRHDSQVRPTNAELVAGLDELSYRIEPFGVSDLHANDGMYNFLATPSTPV